MHHYHRTKPRISRIEPLESRIAPATFFVLNTNDTGAGSLRQAIVDANAAPNGGAPDLISFASIPTSGPFVIQPLSPLPAIIEAVIIDGYTAPNTSVNTLAIGTDAVLRVEINAALQGNGHGLVLSGTGGSTVTGLVIRGTPSAINDNGDGVSVRSDNNVVAGNFIGTDVTGTLDFGNRSSQVSVGLFLGTDVFTGNVIGGTAPAARNILSGGALGISLTDDSFGTIIQGNLIGTDRTGNVAIPNNNTGIGGSAVDTLIGGSVAGAGNVISGNDGWGINFSGSNTTIQGNIIGLNAAGNAPLPNTRSGINFSNGATTALVGGAGAGQANVISGNDGEGIEIGSSFGDGPGNGITVLGNFIGTNASGVMGLGNGGPGIGVYGTNGAIIGGVNPGQRNVIAFNGGDGVFMQEVATEIYGVTVSGNSIHSNVGLGINIADLGDNFFGVTGNDSIDSKDKDTGPNGLQNFPIGTGFTNNGSNITLDGFLASKANASYRLEFFAMAPGQVDLSGHGEGFLFLGSQVVTTTIDGDAGFSFGAAFNLPPDTKFAATATDLTTGETSEFGPAFGPATTFTWTGAVDADWFNSGNWSPGGVPGPLDTAVLGSGTIMLDELATVAGFQQTGGTLDGLGELNVLGTWTWMGGAHAGGTLRTIEGSTAILNGGTALQWMDGDLENRGTLTVQGLGVQFERGTLSNGGDVTLLAGFTDSDAMLSPVTVFNYGSIIKSGATDFGFEGITVENQGGLIRSESTSFFPNFLIGTLNQFDGVTAVAQGGYIVPGGIQLFGGFFDGSNTGEFVTANVTNSGGVVRPGGPDAVGFIFLTGDYIQTSGGTLEIEIGTGLGFPSDEFYVSGGSIDGALLHKTIDGRIIRAGDSFAVVNGGLSGSFSTVNGQPPLNVAYNANDITLFATGFTVTNVNDSGAGSLRQAILDANAQPGFDFISFNIPAGGVQTIRPLTELPVITEAVNIDGYSQPGANANTLAVGSDAVLRIELDGSLVPNGPGSESGITFGGTGALTVSGLIINRFDGYGVELLSGTGSRIAGNWIGPANDGGAMGNSQFGIWLDDTDGVIIGGTSPADRNVISNNDGNGIEISNAASGAIIQGNYIGTDASGTAALPNGFDGIYTQGANTQIGGIAPGAGNVISASLNSVGILINTATAAGSRVEGNFIGTDATGMVDLGNFSFGVEVGFTPNVTIGGTAAGAGNLISGNGDAGIAISGAASTGAIVHGNRVGTDVGGAMPLGNDGGGVAVFAASGASIGGISAGEGNVIAFNTGDGVKVDLSGGTAAGNAIRGNSIHSNTKLGINLVAAGDPDNGITANDADDLDAGANALLNFPVLTSFTAGVLSGNYHGLANTTFTLDIYGSAVADPSGNGEGEMLIATTSITTDGSGNATFSLPGLGIASGFITATATRDSTGDTSEFSNAIAAAAAGSTFVWDGGGGADTSWFNALNWDTDTLPGVNDNVILNTNATITLNTTNVTVNGLQMSAGTLTGDATLSITTNFTWTGGAMTGSGNTTIEPGATADLNGPTDRQLVGRTLENRGDLTWSGVGQLVLDAAQILNVGTFTLADDVVIAVSNPSTFENQTGATLRKSAGSGTAVISAGGAVTNMGTIESAAGVLDLGNSFVQDDGALVLGGGNFATPGSLLLNGGVLAGSGHVFGNLNNVAGVVSPGNSPGQIVINGDFEQGPLGVLDFEIEGVNPGEFDTLTVTGTATLDGTVNVFPINGFVPLGGTIFTLITAGAIVGSFANGNAPGFFLFEGGTEFGVIAGSFEVINADDSGPGSLRDAILAANVIGGGTADTITFNIPGPGPFNIALASALPTITDSIIIDGYTQSGAAFNESGIGIDATLLIVLDGSGAGAGVDGLSITTGSSTVRGLVIGGFDGAGIRITGDGNTVTGNFIGTDASGTSAFGNTTGIFVTSAYNTIGGATPAERNLISGNSSAGTALSDGAGVVIDGVGAIVNAVQGNYIGVDATGLVALGNSNVGVGIYNGASFNSIDGVGVLKRNIISGNGAHGVDIAFSSNGNRVVGAFIGVGADGVTQVGNTGHGVLINSNSNNNRVGEADSTVTTVIAGNFGAGVAIAFGSASNQVLNSAIGMTADRLDSLANGQAGVVIGAAGANNIVGGQGFADANWISGGGTDGVRIENGTDGSAVYGNVFGQAADGADLGDSGSAVRITDGSNNAIGGLAFGQRNGIQNSRLGVVVNSGTGNRILGNTFLPGVETPIDLGDDEADDNDPGDLDAGPNNLQNFPVLTSALIGGGGLGVSGTLDTLPGNYTVQVYVSDTTSDFGHGLGAAIGTFPVLVSGGDQGFSATIPGVSLPSTAFISAIVVNDATGDTSEFSLAIAAAGANGTIVDKKTPLIFADADGDTVKVTLTGKGSLNVLLEGGAQDNADIFSIVLVDTDLTSKLNVVITSKPQFDQSFGTTIGSIFANGALQHVGSITLGKSVTLGGGVADALPDLRVTGKMNTLTLDDLAPNTFIKLGQDLPYDLPGNKAPDTRNHQPALTVGDVLGAGVNIEVLGDGTPAGVGGGGFKSVTFNSWAFDGFLRTTQGIGKFLIKTGDFFGVLEVDKFRVGEETTANVGSMVVSQGSWGSSGSEIEGNIGSFDVQGFALGATITAGSMGRVKSAGELAGTFILTDPDAGGVPTFTVNSDFSARIISAVSIKKLKIKGDFTGSLEAPSIGSISAFSFLGTMGATEIVANAGKLGTLKSTTGVVRDYAIVTDEAFSGISVKGRKLSADTVGIENVSITAASIGKITVDLASDSRSAGVSLTGIRDSEFITTATGTAKGTQGSIANVTVKLKGGAGGDGTGMENVTLDARVLAGEFGVGARASTANPLGNLSVKVSGFGGASAGIVNGDFHGDTIGKTNVSVTRGGGGTARGVDGVIYMATGAIGAMKFGGGVTQNMIENLQVLAGGKLAGLNVAAKDSALGSIVDSAILAGQSLALTGSEKEQKAALSAASLGAVKIAGSLIGTQIVAGASIGGVTVGGNATNSLILAGAMLGGDFTLGDGDETFQRAAAVSSVTVKGAFTRSSIVAGIASTNATFGDADDALAAVAGALAQSSSIGSVKLGAGSGTNVTAPAIPHSFAIQAAAIKSLANEGSSTVKDFAAVLYLDSGAAGEDADDVLVRLRS